MTDVTPRGTVSIAFTSPVPLGLSRNPLRSHDRTISHKRTSRCYQSMTLSSSPTDNPNKTAQSPLKRKFLNQKPFRFISRKTKALVSSLNSLEQLTRPASPPGTESSPRYASLPPHVQTPSQMLGRLTPGCEGTHGVFPKCNFACTPCYHSKEANKVRVDGLHTVIEIANQMKTLQKLRGQVGHCQLIGGEVSLLEADDHARALEVMRFYGRIPMSFTHGDFGYEYLERLCTEDGKGRGRRKRRRKRFDRVDFAVHFDRFMVGRTGIKRPTSEKELMGYRKRFVEMFERLRREYGVKYYLAHNMTVQPGNLDEVSEVVKMAKGYGWRMMSFQPAAYQGDERRWASDYSRIAKDDGEVVWKQIEKGAGCRLPYRLFQMGDFRCNRTCVGALIGPKDDSDCAFVPFFDDRSKVDERVRDAIMTHVGNIVLKPRILAIKIARVLITRPWLIFLGLAWCMSFAARAGGLLRILRYRIRIITFVMHRFMDATNVKKAWKLMDEGVSTDDLRVEQASPQVKETMERLAACSYGMAQVGERRIVPACVQHSVYDEKENLELMKELKLGEKSSPASSADVPISGLHAAAR